MPASRFKYEMVGFDTAPTPYLDGLRCSKVIERGNIQPGNGAGQVQTVTCADQVLALSATLAVDLQTDLDGFGVALALDEVVALYIENASDGAGGTIEVRPSAANGFTNLLGAASAVKLPPGTATAFFLTDFDGVDKWLSTGTNKGIDIVETGGASSAHVIVQLWGRK